MFKIITMLLFLIILIKIKNMQREGMTGDSIGSNQTLNSEALSNIASVYNSTGTLTVPSLKVTGNVEIDGELKSKRDVFIGSSLVVGPYEGDVSTKQKQWIIHVPNDNRNILHFSPKKRDGSDWEWGRGITMNNIETRTDVIANGMLHVNGGSRFQGDRNLFKDSEDAGWLRVGAVHGEPGIHATSGKLRLSAADKIVVAGHENDIHSSTGQNNIAAVIYSAVEPDNYHENADFYLFRGDIPQLAFGDTADYIRVFKGYKVRLFQHHYNGTTGVFAEGVHRLPSGLINEASSAKVRYVWEDI